MLEVPNTEVAVVQWTLWRRNERDWISCVMLCMLMPADICEQTESHGHLRSQLQLGQNELGGIWTAEHISPCNTVNREQGITDVE